MTTPRRVAAINTATGLDIDTPGGRNTATVVRCTRCAATILVGLDADIAAMVARVDPSALTRSDEATALLSGRRTWRLSADPRRRPLIRERSHWDIAAHPADTVTVVAEHRCGLPLGTPIELTRPRPADDRSTACPF